MDDPGEAEANDVPGDPPWWLTSMLAVAVVVTMLAAVLL